VGHGDSASIVVIRSELIHLQVDWNIRSISCHSRSSSRLMQLKSDQNQASPDYSRVECLLSLSLDATHDESY